LSSFLNQPARRKKYLTVAVEKIDGGPAAMSLIILNAGFAARRRASVR
jgi:hypothetical protein